MKLPTKFLLCAGILAVTSAPSWAVTATCGDNVAFSTYLTAGFTCAIGDKTFSNFSYTASGTNPIAASAITVDTIGPTGTGASFVAGTGNLTGLPATDIGLEFFAPWSVGIGQSSDSFIGFTVTINGGPQLIDDASLVQGGSGFTLGGIAQVTENINGTIQLITVDQNGQLVLGDTKSFSPTGTAVVTKDLSVNGNNGSAAISQLVDVFSQTTVPIPGALPLFATGLVGLWGLRRKRSKQSAVAT